MNNLANWQRKLVFVLTTLVVSLTFAAAPAWATESTVGAEGVFGEKPFDAATFRAGLASESGEETASSDISATDEVANAEEDISLLASNGTAVAEVNGKTYSTLYAAYEAASSGDTIKMLADCEVEHINVAKNLTLDLNGKVIYSDNGTFLNYAIYVNKKGITFTLKDSAGNGMIASLSGCIDLDTSGANFVMESGILKTEVAKDGSFVWHATKYGGVQLDHTNTSFTMNGGSINCSDYYPVYLSGNAFTGFDQSFTMNGGIIQSEITSGDEGAIYCEWVRRASVTVNGGEVYSWGLPSITFSKCHYSTLTITGGEFGKEKNFLLSNEIVRYYKSDGITATISGGYLDGTKAASFNDSDDAKIYITGGIIRNSADIFAFTDSDNPTAKVSGGYYDHNVNKDYLEAGYSWYSVTEEGPLHNWRHVTLERQTVTFDANGGTLTDADSQTVQSGTSLTCPSDPVRDGYVFLGWSKDKIDGKIYDFSKTVVDSFTLYAQWTHYVAKNNTTGKTYSSLGEAVDEASSGDYLYLLQDVDLTEEAKNSIELSGKKLMLVLDGHSISTKNAMSVFSLSNGAMLSIGDNGKGGTISGAAYAIWETDAEGFMMDGGTLKGSKAAVGVAKDSEAWVTVVGGTLEGGTYAVDTAGSGSVSLYKGTFTGSSASAATTINATTAEVAISGGTYNKPVPIAQCAARYIPADGSTAGTYTVQDGYKITFDATGGTFTGDEMVCVVAGKTVAEPTAPTRGGYEFKGWYTDWSFATKFDFSTPPQDDMTLYAKWEGEKVKHTVTFDANGGTTAPEAQTVEDGEYATEPQVAPLRDGYSFKGWHTAATGGTKFDFAATPITDNITLYAQWTEQVVALTHGEDTTYFDNFQDAVKAAQEGDKITLLKDVTLDDSAMFTNGAVTLDLNGKTLAGAETLDPVLYVNSGLTIIDSNPGGTIASTIEDDPLSSVILVLSGATLNVNGGNITSASGNGIFAAYDANVNITSGTINTAHEAVYVTEGTKLSISDGTLTSANSSVINAYSDGIKVNIAGGTFTSATDAYFDIFADEDDKDAINVSGGTFSFAIPLEQCAENYIPKTNTGTPTTYTVERGWVVTFDANGGTLTGDATSMVAEGSKLAKPSDPTPAAGYAFKGWYTAATGGEAFDFNSGAITATTTLYAQYAPIEYKINYNLDGGTNDPANPSTYTIESADIVLKDATKDGAIFLGWYNGEEEVVGISKGSTGDITLDAKWTNAVASMSDSEGNVTYYDTLQKAFDAATKEGVTITLLQDVPLQEAAKLNDGKVVDFELNGHTVTAADGSAIEVQGSTLVISDDSEAESGSIVGTTCAVKVTEGNFALFSGTLKATSGGAALDVVGADTAEASSYHVILTGGTIDGGAGAGVKLSNKGIAFSVNDSTISGAQALLNTDTSNALEVQSGSFKGETNPDISTPDGTEGFVTGGVFAHPVALAQCADGYIPAANEDEATKATYPYTVAEGYKVNFDLNGAEGSIDAQYVKTGEKAAKPADPSRESYVFGGWYTDAECSAAYDFDSAVESNLTLYAKWTITYTVTIDAHGGAFSDGTTVQTQKVEEGGKLTNLETPTRAGYTFRCWSADEAGEIEFDPEEDEIMGDGTIYAQWIKNPVYYKVHFNAKGGVLTGDATQTVKEGGKASKPTDPTYSGYTFKGWTTDEAGESEFDFANTVITNNITLYAQWDKVPEPVVTTFTVTLDANGGTLAGAATETVEEGKYATEPLDPFRSGYKFAGWFTEVEGGTEYFVTPTAITADTTLYAHWEQGIDPEVFEVTVEAHGGTFSDGSTTQDLWAENGTLLKGLETPTREGYKFRAWTTDAAGEVIFDPATDAVTDELTLYAQWTKDPEPTTTYQVIFNANGGTIEGQSGMAVEVKAGECVTEPEIPVRDGYTFDGWYTAEEGGEKFDFVTAINANTLLYAHWTKKSEPTPSPTPVNPGNKGNGGSGKELPQTGDATNIAAIAALGVAGIAITGAGLALNKRKK